MRIPLPIRSSDGSYEFKAAMAIDGDGANGASSAPVYAPAGFTPSPLDFLANAGAPGNWYGIITDDGEASGEPIRQGQRDPAPGAFISATTYEYAGYDRTDPNRYVDANAVPYFVIPSHWRAEAVGVVLGCRGTIMDIDTGAILECVVGDLGPRGHAGEASIAVARFFGVPSSPKNGGTDEARFLYTFFPDIPALVDGVEYALIPA